jgi:hypothetical protein
MNFRHGFLQFDGICAGNAEIFGAKMTSVKDLIRHCEA